MTKEQYKEKLLRIIAELYDEEVKEPSMDGSSAFAQVIAILEMDE